MNLTPFIKTPFTDLAGHVMHSAYGGKCVDFEIKMMSCLEAYGMYRGKKVCKDIIDDFNECQYLFKQDARDAAMRKERERQYANGELSEKDRYAPPPKIGTY